MKKGILIILCGIFTLFNFSILWAITDKDRKLAMKATECFEQKDFICARQGYEQLLKSKLNKVESDAIKAMLRSTYFDLVKENVENEHFPKSVETYCLKGIGLGDELRANYDEEDVGFHIWLTMYYFHHNNKAKTRQYIGKLEELKSHITGYSEVDKAARGWIDRVVSVLEDRM